MPPLVGPSLVRTKCRDCRLRFEGTGRKVSAGPRPVESAALYSSSPPPQRKARRRGGRVARRYRTFERCWIRDIKRPLSGVTRNPLALFLYLLQGRHPVFHVIGGSQLSVLCGEDIDSHCVEAFARRLRPPEFLLRHSGRLPSHHDLVAEDMDIPNLAMQVGHGRSHAPEHVG